MTKLVEHRCHLIPRQQRRLAFWCFRTIAHVEDDGLLIPVTALFSKAIHPRTTAFCCTTVVVAIEECQRLAILVDDLEHAHIWMICRNVGTLLERQTIGPIGSIEHTIDQHAVNIEIRLYLVLADVQHGFLHLGRIVEAVVRFKLEVSTLGLLCKFLDGLCLSVSLRTVGSNQTFQEVVDVFRCLGHRVVQRIGGIAGIAHDFCLFGTQLSHLADNIIGIILRIGSVGTMNAGFVNLFAKFTIVKTGQWSLLRGIHDDNGIRRLTTTTFSILLALGNVGLAKSCQVFLLVNPHDGIVGGSLKEVAPLLLKVTDAQVDFLHAGHLIVGQEGTLAHEVLIDFLQQFLVFTLQLVVLLVVHPFDARKQLLIKGNLVAKVCQHRLHLLLYLADFVSLISLRQCEEYGCNTSQLPTTVLERQDGILECGRVLIVDNGLDIVARLLHGSLEGRHVVSHLNLTEIWCTKRQRTLCQQRILARGLLAGIEC